MKPIHGLVFAFALSTVVFACMAWWSLFHMATLYDRIHALESLPAKAECSQNSLYVDAMRVGKYNALCDCKQQLLKLLDGMGVEESA